MSKHSNRKIKRFKDIKGVFTDVKVKDVEYSFLSGRKPYLWISLVGFVLYFQSLFFGFTYLDDNVLILDNLFFLKNWGNIFKVFTIEVFHVLHASAAYYRPMLTISFMIDAIFSGSSPFFYHLSSVLIHLGVSCMVYLFLYKLGIKKILSFFFALLFTVHPVLSQAVSWVPGRNDSLLALFLLPCLIFLIKYFESKSIKYLYWHFIFFALSIFTKESGVLISLIVGFYGWFLMNRKEFIKALPILGSGYFFLYLIWFFLRSIALSGNPVSYTIKVASEIIIENSSAVLLYIGKVLFPVNLSVLPILQDSTLIYGAAALVIISILLVVSKRKNIALIVFGLLWFIFFLLPSFIRPQTGYVADFIEHRIYVPIIGLFIIFSQMTVFKKINNQRIYFVMFGFILSVMFGINLIYSRNFKDRITFWKDAVANSPHHPLSHKNLGAMYYLDGKLDAALPEFNKALELNPVEPMIHNNIGLIYFDKKMYKESEAEYQKELALYPSYDNALYNLGLLYYTQGKKEAAADMWLKTISSNPDHKSALKNLALYYKEIGDQQKYLYFNKEAVKRGITF